MEAAALDGIFTVEHFGDINALRERAALDAELEALAIRSLLGDVVREPRRERQIVAHLADDERGAQVAGVNLHVSVGLLLDDPYGTELLQHGWRQVAVRVQRRRPSKLASVHERRWK